MDARLQIFDWVKSLFIGLIFALLSHGAQAEDYPPIQDIITTVNAVLAYPVMEEAEYVLTFNADEQIIHAILQDDMDRASSLMEDHKSTLQYGDLFEAFLSLNAVNTQALEVHPEFEKLNETAEAGLWPAQHISNLFLSNIYLKRGDGFLGLKYANDSLSAIPNSAEAQAQNAHFNSHYMLHIAYAMDRSPKAVFNTVQKLMEIYEGQAFPFEQFSTIYNLSASFYQASEYSTALEISKSLLEHSAHLSDYSQFISNLSYGRNLINLDRNQEAQRYIKKSIRLAPNKTYEIYARVLWVETLTELGKFAQAQTQIDIIEASEAYHSDNGAGEQGKILKSKSLIEAGSEKFERAFHYYRDYADKKIEGLNKALSSDRRDLHRRVLLSQELAEKEIEKAELQFVLDQERLIRQRTLNQIYLGFIILGIASVFGAIFFVRKVAILNDKLHISNELVKDKSKIKSQLLAMFSHEMLTPLNGIIPLADLLRQSEMDSHKQHLLKTIEVNGAELTRKIREIILVANADDQVNHPDVINVVDFLQKAQDKFDGITPRGVVFNVRIGTNMPDGLWLDGERLESITEALLSNSMKYTKRGEVRLSFYLDERHRPILEFSDTGQGIKSHLVDDMIKPFGQSSLSMDRVNQGLGLGLTIVRLQCDIMQAAFTIKSEEGVGTVAHIVFNEDTLKLAKNISQEAA